MVELRQVMEDDDAKLVVRTMMERIGFANDPGWYGGASAFMVRVSAADRLEEVIQDYWKEHDDIAHPQPVIMKTLRDIARNEPDNTVVGTYSAARLAIFGHIWLRKLQRIKTHDFVTNQAVPAICALMMRGVPSGGGTRLLRKPRIDRGRFTSPFRRK